MRRTVIGFVITSTASDDLAPGDDLSQPGRQRQRSSDEEVKKKGGADEPSQKGGGAPGTPHRANFPTFPSYSTRS